MLGRACLGVAARMSQPPLSQPFISASRLPSDLQWYRGSHSCALNWIRRLIQIKINPVKWNAAIFNTDEFTDPVHCTGSYANTRKEMTGEEKKKKKGAALFFPSTVWFYLKVRLETQLENILKAMNYAQGNPLSWQVQMCIKSGRFLYSIFMSKRVPLYQIHVYLYQCCIISVLCCFVGLRIPTMHVHTPVSRAHSMWL